MTINLVGDWPANLAKAAQSVNAVLISQPDIKAPIGVVNLKLVDASESQALNKRYSGNAYATDVLTFNYHESEPLSLTAADIAICLPVAEKQARAAGSRLEDELALLTAHGLLHVCGHDHADSRGRVSMESRQQQIIKLAGYEYREYKWEQ